MPDITTTQIFSDGEKGITATKMNNIIANSVIQPDFVSAKPVASSTVAGDQLLVLKSAGTYAKIDTSAFASSMVPLLPDPNPNIWTQRLRSYNGLINPNFAIDQRNVGASFAVTPSTPGWVDGWSTKLSGTLRVSSQQQASGVVLPGGNFIISQTLYRVTVTTAQTTLGSTDYCAITQTVEGPRMRELFSGDNHSVSILVKSSVANLKFGLALQDANKTWCLAKLCNIGLANSWQLITFPNLPQWTASGSFPLLPGSAAYYLNIVLAAGSSVPANDTWQNTTAFGAVGISNFVTGISNTFDLGFIQHEPGPLCSTPMDKPWTQNYDECLRYFAKSYDYNTPINTVTDDGCIYGVVPTSNLQTAPTRVSFPKPLAIKPTALNAYSTHGGVNAAWDFSAGANKAVTAISAYSEKSFSQITISAASTAGAVLAYHYVADTGW